MRNVAGKPITQCSINLDNIERIMMLFLISQEVNSGYDTFDSAIVAAEESADAATISPYQYLADAKDGKFEEGNYVWATKVSDVRVKYIGEAAADMKRGVILASFNAG